MKETKKIAEIANIRDEMLRLAKRLDDVMNEQTFNILPEEDWMKTRIELWARVFNEGGVVSMERLYEIWTVEMKKDKRGLGGFYVGKRPSLMKLSGDKVALTKNADEFVQEYLNKTLEEYAQNFKA